MQVKAVALTCVLVSLGLLVSACGTSNSSSAQGSSALAFARCMRANGVSRYPDPASSGQLVKESPEQLGVSSSQFQSAQSACRRLLPNGGNGPSAAQVQQIGALSLHFAQCVRAHGVPGFPDPDSSGRIPDPASVGVDQGSPKFEQANDACASYRPPYMPSNAAYNTWARSHGQ